MTNAPFSSPAPGSYERPAPAANFFNRIRSWGIVRTEDRWLGGVSAGIAHRFGLDPALVRVLFVLLAFIGGGVIVYGLGWLFLPEQRDGRIPVQEAMRGSFPSAFWLGLLVVLVAIFGPLGVIGGAGALVLALPFLLILAIPVLLVWVIIRLVEKPARPGAYGPNGDGPQAGQGGQPGYGPNGYGPQGGYGPGDYGNAGPANGGPMNGGTAPFVPAAEQAQQADQAVPNSGVYTAPPRPARRRPSGPGVTHSLLTLAALLFVWSALAIGVGSGNLGLVGSIAFGAGATLAVFGGSIIIAALRGRTGGWVSVVGLLASFVAVPAIVGASFLPASAINGEFSPSERTITVTREQLEQAGDVLDLGTYSAANVRLNLSELTAEDTERLAGKSIVIDSAAGYVQVLTSAEQAVTVQARVHHGYIESILGQNWSTQGLAPAAELDEPSHYTLSGETLNQTLNRQISGSKSSATIASPNTAPGITVQASMGIGEISVQDRTFGTSWSGIKDTIGGKELWIVDYWRDAQGAYHSRNEGLPAVEGKAADSIAGTVSSSAVEQCLSPIAERRENALGTSVNEDADDSFDSPSSDWDDLDTTEGLSNRLASLTDAERTAYETCLTPSVQPAK